MKKAEGGGSRARLVKTKNTEGGARGQGGQGEGD